jgi:omega-3 fatty acid desaturase (delta-15 desaturase)
MALGLAWFGYLLIGFSERKHRHWNPNEAWFKRHQFAIYASMFLWLCTFSAVVWFGVAYGLAPLCVYYLFPILIFASWLVINTFLHHNDDESAWFSLLRLSKCDSWGWFGFLSKIAT